MPEPHLIPKGTKQELVTIQAFGEIIQTPVRTVRDLIDRRIIPVVKIRRWLRIPRQKALAALERYEIQEVKV